jgi:stage V sporulation protein G
MNITDCKIHKMNTEGNLKAMVSVTFDHCFVVTGLKLMHGTQGLFVAMPSKKLDKPNAKGKEYIDTSFPLNADFRQYLNDYVIATYNTGKTPEYASTAGFSDRVNENVPPPDEEPF